MAFFTGSSRFHTVKRSGSPRTESQSSLLSMLDEIDELDADDKVPAESKPDDANPSACEHAELEPTKTEAAASPAGAERKPRRITSDAEKQVIMALVTRGTAYTEIGKILDMKPNTVQKFISRQQKRALIAVDAAKHAHATTPPKSKTTRVKKAEA